MRTPSFFLTLTAAATLLLSSCDNKAATETTTTETTTAAPAADSSMMASPEGMMAGNYTCPMHPEVHSDHPGKCPKCGMNLVEASTIK